MKLVIFCRFKRGQHEYQLWLAENLVEMEIPAQDIKLSDLSSEHFDAIIIGSGFGGMMTAHALVKAGWKVLMLERGGWVPRSPANWGRDASVDLTPYYTMETPLRVLKGGNKKTMGLYSCVGGPSVFYGAVSFRFREADFHPGAEITAESEAEWPFQYGELEPFYSRAEQMLNIAGSAGSDPTEPFRSEPYPQQAPRLSKISQRIKRAANGLQLRPFPLPLAINYHSQNNRAACQHCTTCDTFACAIEAKNDLATVVLPELLREGLLLVPETVVCKLHQRDGKIAEVEAVSRNDGGRHRLRARTVVLSAGAMSSPHLLLASGLEEHNPGGKTIGRFLMRHVNAIVFGIFPGPPDPENRFHKQLGILDFYFGHPSIEQPSGKLGSIQQLQTPPAGLVEGMLPKPFGKIISPGVKLLTGLLNIAEDQPQFHNGLGINWDVRDRFGLPQLQVSHQYSARDLAALKALTGQSRKILRRTGALAHYTHHIRTFSHAVGTVRTGKNPETSALDRFCRFRGIDNLFVVDGSFMPTSAGLNPSLTIAANALRVGDYLSGQSGN